MRRFKGTRNFQKLFPILEAVIASIVLFSWLFSTSTAGNAAIEIASECLRQLAGCFNHCLFIFALVNALILVILSLSRLQKPSEPDFYDQYLSFASATASTSTTVDKSSVAGDRETFEDKQIVLIPVKNAVSVSRAKEKTVQAVGSVIETGTPARRRTAIRAVITVTDTVPTRREISSVTEGETKMNPRNEGNSYRRSRSERIDDLNNEEFRATVETFIAAKRKTLLQEWIAERRADAAVAV